MKDLVKQAKLEDQFHIESAATSTEELGNPVYPRRGVSWQSTASAATEKRHSSSPAPTTINSTC